MAAPLAFCKGENDPLMHTRRDDSAEIHEGIPR